MICFKLLCFLFFFFFFSRFFFSILIIWKFWWHRFSKSDRHKQFRPRKPNQDDPISVKEQFIHAKVLLWIIPFLLDISCLFPQSYLRTSQPISGDCDNVTFFSCSLDDFHSEKRTCLIYFWTKDGFFFLENEKEMEFVSKLIGHLS